MATINFGRTPVWDLVTPKQFLWFRDFPTGTVTGLNKAGYPLQIDTNGKLADYTATSNNSAYILVTDTDRSDVQFADGVTVVSNAVSFVGKVSTAAVSGTVTPGAKMWFDDSIDMYKPVAASGKQVIAVAETGAQGGWVTLRYLSGDNQHLSVSGTDY